MTELTEKEKLVYDYIGKYIEENGYPPTVRDICAHTGIKSTSSVYTYIGRLEEKGAVVRNAGKSRAINTVSRDKIEDAVRVPLLGRVTAGTPILAVEDPDGYVCFDPNGKTYGKNDLFALKVRGVSMIEAGIMDGDTVIVQKTSSAENGDVVVALINDEATVKVFYKENGGFRLQPRNSSMEPIIVKELSVLGKVIASVRYYD